MDIFRHAAKHTCTYARARRERDAAGKTWQHHGGSEREEESRRHQQSVREISKGTSQSISQSVCLQINQFVRLLGNQTVGIRSVNQETSQTVRKPVGQSAGQESAQSESQSVSQ